MIATMNLLFTFTHTFHNQSYIHITYFNPVVNLWQNKFIGESSVPSLNIGGEK